MMMTNKFTAAVIIVGYALAVLGLAAWRLRARVRTYLAGLQACPGQAGELTEEELAECDEGLPWKGY